MARALIGKKIGMTQVFDPEGNLVPVTVLQMGPNPVVQVKQASGRDGYDAIQIGFDPKKLKRANRPELGIFKAAGIDPVKHLQEIRLDSSQVGKHNVGDVLDLSLFTAGEKVDVTARSKGRGFQGVVKRHGFKGAKEATHGTHEYKRHSGSIGCSAYPGHVIKGKKMAGQMGDKIVTTRGLKIVSIYHDDNIVLIKGAIPGAIQSIVRMRATNKGKKIAKTA
jgi:large subunit ribosomal protein L3